MLKAEIGDIYTFGKIEIGKIRVEVVKYSIVNNHDSGKIDRKKRRIIYQVIFYTFDNLIVSFFIILIRKQNREGQS